MPPVPRIATIVHSAGTGSRTHTATAAVQDTAAGGSVVVTVTESNAGATPPSPADTITLRLRTDAGTVIRTVTAPGVETFFFSDTGLTGGSPRWGTVEIELQVTRTSIPTYDISSDGAPNTPQAGFTTTLNQGWIRGTTTLVEDISNQGLGVAPVEPAKYGETLSVRTTCGAVSYVARALTVVLSHGSVSGTTSSTTAAIRDVTFAAVVDDRFPAAVTSVGLSVTVPNATLTGLPDTVFTTTTDDTLSVDPRATLGHHFQTDDETFAVAKNEPGKSMLSTQTGLAATRFVDSRGFGIDGLSVTQSADPANPGTTATAASVTATLDGQAGWTGFVDISPTGKPGGAWVKTVDVTAPAGLDAATHLVNNTDTLTVLAPDPRIEVAVTVGPATVSEADHMHVGDSVHVAATVHNRVTRQRVAADAGTVLVSLFRWQRALARFEFLELDGTTWTAWDVGVAAATHPLTDSGDGATFTLDLLTTSGWTTADIASVQVTAEVAGTPYGAAAGRELVGAFNGHNVEDAVTPADITAIANAVWDELTAEARTAGSYGQTVKDRLDVAVSTRARPADVTVTVNAPALPVQADIE